MMLGLQRLHCRRVRHALWDYVAERLSEGMLETVERHLTVCAGCRREAESMRRAQGLLSACRQEPIPPPRSDWNALRARLQTEVQIAPHAVEPRRHLSHVYMRHQERLAAQRRGRWVSSLARSGAFAGVLLLTAFGYRSLHTVNAPTPQQKDPGTFATGQVPENYEPAPAGSPMSPYDPNLYDGPGNKFVPSDFGVPSHNVQNVADVRRPNDEAKRALLVRRQKEEDTYSQRSFAQQSIKKAHNQHKPLDFQPYKPRPEDTLPQTEPAGDHYITNGVVPIPNSNGDAYMMPSMRPVPTDGDSPY